MVHLRQKRVKLYKKYHCITKAKTGGQIVNDPDYRLSTVFMNVATVRVYAITPFCTSY